LRDYGEGDQIGLEPTPDEFVEQLCLVFDEVWRVLKDDGTLWLNLGDSFWSDTLARQLAVESMWGNRPGSDLKNGRNKIPTNNRRGGIGKRPDGIKPKDLIGIPWRVALALQARGWYLRSDIIWHKPNPMPESVTDRPTKSHEYIFLLTKSPRYYYDHEAIKEDSIWANDARAGAGRIAYDGKRQGNAGEGQEAFVTITDKKNKRTVWTVNTKPYKDAHFATYPPELIEPCILAGSGEGDIVLDPFSGSGTTGEMALKHGRNYIGLELNPEYATLSEKRLTEAGGMFAAVKISKGTEC
jgi:DNA modification methylase